MATADEDERPRKKTAHAIGEDLSMLSLAELNDRIGLLKQEILRLEQAIQEKSASRNAAQSIFRK